MTSRHTHDDKHEPAAPAKSAKPDAQAAVEKQRQRLAEQGGPDSINEPPGSDVKPVATAAAPANTAKPAKADEPVYDEDWEREDDDKNEVSRKKKHK